MALIIVVGVVRIFLLLLPGLRLMRHLAHCRCTRHRLRTRLLLPIFGTRRRTLNVILGTSRRMVFLTILLARLLLRRDRPLRLGVLAIFRTRRRRTCLAWLTLFRTIFLARLRLRRFAGCRA